MKFCPKNRVKAICLGAFGLVVFFSVLVCSGCGDALAGKSDVAGIKITDFSRLQTPGEGFSAIYVVISYEIRAEKFAPIRIFAEQLQRLPEGGGIEPFETDGFFCGLASGQDYRHFQEALIQSDADKLGSITFLFYDSTSEYYWFEPLDDAMLIYTDFIKRSAWLFDFCIAE